VDAHAQFSRSLKNRVRKNLGRQAGRFFEKPEKPEVLPKKPYKHEVLFKKPTGFFRLNVVMSHDLCLQKTRLNPVKKVG